MHTCHFRIGRPPVLLTVLLTFDLLLGTLRFTEAASRPNVVLIVSDDHAYSDFGFMGNEIIQTPHLDRLAACSARFPNGYLPESVCRPTIASIITGLHPHQHMITFNHPPNPLGEARHAADYLIRQVPTLPRILKQVGFVSFQTGKWWEGHYSNGGFDEGMTLGGEHWIMPDLGWRKAHGNGDAGLLIGRRTMKPIECFLKQHGDEPFFLWYAPVLPHVPHNVAPKHLEPYKDNPRVPAHMKRYYASITRFDDTVGQLLDMLQQRDLLRNTLFVFVVDNGWLPRMDQPDRHDPRTKTSPYEFGIRTPILIRWDGHTKPATHQELVSALDIVPTIQAAVGVESKGLLPGINLLPAADGEARLPERPMFGANYRHQCRRFEHPEEELLARWVRLGKLKLIQPVPGRGEPMLFNVVEDPHERNNLAEEPGFVDEVTKRQRLLDQWWDPEDKAKANEAGPGP